MPGIFRALRPTFRYWMRTETHVYAFSIAANVLLSFYPFLIVSTAVASRFFGRATALSAIDLALNDFFPDTLGNFLHNNPPPRGKVEIISLFLLVFTANGVFQPLEVGLNQVWGIGKNRSFLRNQLVSLALIFICGGMALGSLLLTAFSQESFRNLTGASPGVDTAVAFFGHSSDHVQDGGGADHGAGALFGVSISAERKTAARSRDTLGHRGGRAAGSVEAN
jgi:uncharacterized BrkB/YihY/UPF0761 family membrane protein